MVNSFQCPQDVSVLLFSQLSIYYYTDICKTLGITFGHKNTKDELSTKLGEKPSIFPVKIWGFRSYPCG